MSTPRLMQFTLTVLIISGFGAAPATPAPEVTPEQRTQALELELMSTRQQNAALVKKNAALEQQVRRLQVQLATRVAPRIGTEPNPIPDGWIPRKFNGTTVYLVPLDAGQTVAPTTRPARK